jgi:hypothetical protein
MCWKNQKPTRAMMKRNMSAIVAHQPLDLPRHLHNVHQWVQSLQLLGVAVIKRVTIATDVLRIITHDWEPIARTLARCHHRITAHHDMGRTMKTKPSIPDDLTRDITMADQIQLCLLPPTSADGAKSGSLRDVMIMTKAITSESNVLQTIGWSLTQCISGRDYVSNDSDLPSLPVPKCRKPSRQGKTDHGGGSGEIGVVTHRKK